MQFYFELISGKRKGLLANCLRALLWCLSLFFGVLVFIRKWIYRHIKKYRPHVLTISVGNITAGGTGKTPFTIYLAEKIRQKHFKNVAILLRGYKSKAESAEHPFALLGGKADFRYVGDEALVIARALPTVPVYVGKKRALSARLAEEKGAECLILDDGMQHFRIERDVEIVVIDAKCPFGYGYLLPRGLLREPLAALKRADLIVLTRVDRVPGTQGLEVQIASLTQAPIIKTTLTFDGLYDQENKRQKLEKCKVGLFCGIGNPEAFYELVASLGFEVVMMLFLQDHEVPDPKKLQDFAMECRQKQAGALLCTEKDIVKIGSLSLSLPIYWTKVHVKVVEGEEVLDQLISNWVTV